MGALGVAGSRVYLGYHTTAQVLVGGVLGVFVAFAWFTIGGWEEGRKMAVEWGRIVWVRDGCRGVDLVEDSYWKVVNARGKVE